ncbi:cytoplasmic tRNA 2-thiolation protein 1 [Babesia microti strain RI]|uniref:Cytoplasmic tRNA 2-thiolation protein 1 n=1 Tax=Babesia microti (strain RI) TaxID=1133968 RepID=I7ISX7_BABMR|nr:cytoplasmic tRNA 2-thiolation protein 1 [Babesia microti strain RI]CCF75941.1 cytoplasmic tRNA 2-thiolation protein 1 [Babesia microti strain RI]|eukprot:XP_012650349.1 cytoplasmic tRNA 2-thiolation protein 1 [Babesia microti strain RI]
MICNYCNTRPPCLIRQFTGRHCCKECFLDNFVSEIHETIVQYDMINNNDRVCVGVSGGKDSSVLIDILYNIKVTYGYSWQLFLLAIDEGIKGYRDDSLAVVQHIKDKYNLPLEVLSFKHSFGRDMDEIVIKTGSKNNCTVCGVYRRNLLNQGGKFIQANKICTGHNADDVAETLLLNLFRGDSLKLVQQSSLLNNVDGITRIKPLFKCAQKEIVLYARYANIEYFSTECKYLKDAYRGKMRDFINRLQITNPRLVINLVNSSLQYGSSKSIESVEIDANRSKCENCGSLADGRLCKMCQITEKLNNTL